ncbi:MAG: prephenate dehydratase domain-containing protein [Chloroherpetonaceae bacterium]|nr:prephenate dehydratase domain-containing protein [Chloroherpetonaceae bacterium]
MSRHTFSQKNFSPPFKKVPLLSYQGEKGAFSEIAALRFGEGHPCPTFYDAFQSLLNGTTDFAILPIENAIGGSVYGVCDSLVEFKKEVEIVGETHIPIQHTVLGIHGSNIETASEIASHPQAIMQCQNFLRQHPHLRIIEAYDTAGAALEVAQLKDPKRLAIASERAAEVYGLSILHPKAADAGWNKTRFLIFKKSLHHSHKFGYFQDFVRFIEENDTQFPFKEQMKSRRRLRLRAFFVFKLAKRYEGLDNFFRGLSRFNIHIEHFTTRPIRHTAFFPVYLLEVSFNRLPNFKLLEAHFQKWCKSSELLGLYPLL